MTRMPDDAREALRRLADALAEETLNAPDDEVLQDAAEIYGDTDKLAAEMLRLFEQTASEQGKARLAAARAAIAASRRRSSGQPRLDPTETRRRLQLALATDPEAARRLTVAARKGEGLSDEDVYSMLEDLEELGVIPSSGTQDSDK
jgi:hypothetical protein